MSSLARKKNSLNASGKSALELRPSHPTRGAARDRHERAVGCGGRGCAFDERRVKRTAKSCGPDAPMLASSLADCSVRRWWQESPVATESTKETVKPLRREGRIASAEPVCSCAHLLCILHTRPRVQRAPGFPCALCFRGGQRRRKTSDISCRENDHAYLTAVIARESGRSSTPRPLGSRLASLEYWITRFRG
jgi:hypothetical protein